MQSMGDDRAEDESLEGMGGRIPGAPGTVAFRVYGDDPSALPVMISVPHAGRAYPRSLLRQMRYPDTAALKLEDRYVDKLGKAIARETGAALLIAHAPRAMIDLNRAPEDVDWEMFGGPSRPDDPAAGHPSRRARSGLGLIPRRLPGMGELWRSRHDEQDLAARIGQIHEPYHARLASMLRVLRERWGAALLIDLHSMPPLVARAGQPAAEFVIGDRFGTTCHGSLVASAFAQFGQAERRVAHNRPYAGGYVLDRHGSPAKGIHAIQIEVDRSCYLDGRMVEVGLGMDGVVALLAGLVRRLAVAVGELADNDRGPAWPLAAE